MKSKLLVAIILILGFQGSAWGSTTLNDIPLWNCDNGIRFETTPSTLKITSDGLHPFQVDNQAAFKAMTGHAATELFGISVTGQTLASDCIYLAADSSVFDCAYNRGFADVTIQLLNQKGETFASFNTRKDAGLFVKHALRTLEIEFGASNAGVGFNIRQSPALEFSFAHGNDDCK